CQAEADRLMAIARANPHTVIKVDGRLTKQSPPPPFITSTLQQSAGQKLRFSPEQTMKVAQNLYEAGHITYMRTDSVALAEPFRRAVKHYLTQHDPTNVPKRTTSHRSAKGAQDAHEAIRPTDVNRTPQSMQNTLSGEQSKLYDLIWNRAIASLCCPAQLRKTRIVTQSADIFWEARGQVVECPGYTRYWNNLKADSQLPTVQQGQVLTLQKTEAEKKQTQPPPRYTEPKLVQLMERKGIGRPSTYAPTIKTLRSRAYVQLVKGKLHPTTLGLELDAALSVLLPDLIQPEFTAQMELVLDAIAHGQQDWQSYLTDWHRTYFGPAIARAKVKVTSGEVQKALQAQKAQEDNGTVSGESVGNGIVSYKNDAGYGDISHGNVNDHMKPNSSPPPNGQTLLTETHHASRKPKAIPNSPATAPQKSTRTKTPCPKCKAMMSKVPSKSKKMRAKHFLKCLTPGCGTVMFWNGKKKCYEQPYSQRQPNPNQFTDHPCPCCGAWLERYHYTKEGKEKEMLRCSLLENRKGKCKDVAYFQTQQGFWSPKFGNL
ncbi:MAG: type IA DNA topoisomerase, partial [Symploca sp. SIO2B6]|nr:type IA DNA topoisomerase [Symploca sp. SIO2B6]